MFVHYRLSKKHIEITIQEGTNKPYYLADKGLKPSGVYIRQGASSVPASFELIRQMIKLTDGDKFEAARSLIQTLTFTETETEFGKRDIEFGENHKKTLGILGPSGLYTNLGLLLSDQCIHTVKVACFNGTERAEFKTRKEFGGSLINQLHGNFEFLQLANNLKASISGLDRIEQYDYPEEAVREALLNAIIHRDYSFSGSTIISIYDDRMEFVSLGGLVPGLSKNDLPMGISQPRNEKLANVFYRLKYIEAYGTGIKKILRLYRDCTQKPVISVSDGVFSIELPNMNYMPEKKSNQDSGLKKQYQTILDYIKSHGKITNREVQNLLQVKQTRAYNILKEMKRLGLL
jgi:ATP-dependent DNA helicase RecG